MARAVAMMDSCGGDNLRIGSKPLFIHVQVQGTETWDQATQSMSYTKPTKKDLDTIKAQFKAATNLPVVVTPQGVFVNLVSTPGIDHD